MQPEVTSPGYTPRSTGSGLDLTNPVVMSHEYHEVKCVHSN